ncbi:hypothetical protein [Streptomyces sp. MS2.AVA.5]|uniref:Uncharacterized protein n=1 Tax=Streptomyces achmelvichensis TaxID=3134111 RepID=A0ACC6Q8A1_9ACTN
MNEEPVVIKLTHDQAFVLSDWLYEVMIQSDKLDAIIPDRRRLVSDLRDLRHPGEVAG